MAELGNLSRTLLFAAALVCLPACSAQTDNSENETTVKRSASARITMADAVAFRAGRAMTDILDDIQWRGNFEAAAILDGKHVSAIRYNLYESVDGRFIDSVWAVFVDDTFEKLVTEPEWPRDFWLRMGEFPLLVQALDGEPMDIANAVASLQEDVPSQVDPFLTVVFLWFRPALIAKMERLREQNTVLRDQFNACRLKLGMSSSDVESVLQSGPMESGTFDHGVFRMYGSQELLDIGAPERYSNILVLFSEDKVVGIYSGSMVPGGPRGRRSMSKWFSDLPPVDPASSPHSAK